MEQQTIPDYQTVLLEARARGASDVFYAPGEPVAFQIDGAVIRSETTPLTPDQGRALAQAAVGADLLARVGTQTGAASLSRRLPGGLDVRATVTRCRGDYSVALRLLPRALPDLAALGVPDVLVSAAEALNGLIVCTGPTGSGKSTVALSLVEHINQSRPVSICTVEDPLAMVIGSKAALVQQREVGSDVPDVIEGIRAAVRQGVDVLFVDSIGCLKELCAALDAATACLVITVAHGTSPQDVVTGLVDMAPLEREPAVRRMLARVVRAISVQCLLPRADGSGRVAAFGWLLRDGEVVRGIIDGGPCSGSARPETPAYRDIAQGITQLREAGIVTRQAAADALARLV